jgi:predicted dehydrogenase
MVQFSYVPSGPGHHYFQRSVHGRRGSMVAPGDRNGRPVIVRLEGRELVGANVLAALPNFRMNDVTERLYGKDGVVYDWPFPRIDAAHLAIELHDFGEAIVTGRAPEVDGYLGMTAVAAIYAAYESAWLGRSVTMDEVLSGRVAGYQQSIDGDLGLIPSQEIA